MKKIAYLLSALTALLLSGCIFDIIDLDGRTAEFERINRFIVEGVHTYYLWENETDWKKYENRKTYAAYTDHDMLFDQLIYQDDNWSMLTDDIDDLGKQFEGVSTTFGYTLKFYRLSASSDTVIAVVLFTSPDSPAATAGLKRGDVIIEMNDDVITEKNYLDLYYASSLRVRCGEIVIEDDGKTKTIHPLPETMSINAVEMYENPIVSHRIIEKEGKKIGYLCYTGYQQQSEGELFQLFGQFKSDGVQDVVLDLRYNPGGFARTALILSSILAPETTVRNKSVYLEHHYNELITKYYKEKKYALNEIFTDTLRFNGTLFDLLSVNMNLSRLYVLTSNRTASASEATMVGLDPYLELIQIGETTSGKYCGGILLSPEDLYDEKYSDYYESFSNWGMYIMIYRYANIKGITSFTGGLVPDIQAVENDFDLKPFGDGDDPLLGRALAHITGVEYIEQRTAKIASPFIALPEIKKPVDGKMIAAPPAFIYR